MYGKSSFSTWETSLSPLSAAHLKIQGMSLELYLCTTAEGSCPPVHRGWEAEFVAACSCFCAVIISNKEKPKCKAQHMEMEVSFIDWESPWGFGYTEDVALSSSAWRSPSVTAEQRHCVATLYQDSKEGSFAA